MAVTRFLMEMILSIQVQLFFTSMKLLCLLPGGTEFVMIQNMSSGAVSLAIIY